MNTNPLAKITANLMHGVRDLAEWGMETGNLTPEALEYEVIRRTPELRRQAASALVETGMSERQAATVLGVSHVTIQRDLRD